MHNANLDGDDSFCKDQGASGVEHQSIVDHQTHNSAIMTANYGHLQSLIDSKIFSADRVTSETDF